MLSRIADSIFWMQRYRERAENVARLIDVNLYLSIDAPGDDRHQWEPLVATTGDKTLFTELHGKATEKNVIEFLTFDDRNPNSILNCLRNARDNARSVRQIITSEIWNEINQLYLFVSTAAASRKKISSYFDFFQAIKRSCQLLTGITDTTFSHSDAWHFGRLGYLLERADQTSRILDIKYFILLPSTQLVGTAYDDIQWGALLKSVSALEMYRKKWHEVRHSNVINFLLLDDLFPRSVCSCLRRAVDSLRAVSNGNTPSGDDTPHVLLGNLYKEFQSLTVYEIVKVGLHEFLDSLQSKISEINSSIYNTFFAPHSAMNHVPLEAAHAGVPAEG